MPLSQSLPCHSGGGGPCEAWWKGRPSLLFQPREILLRVESGGRAVGGGGRQLVDLLDANIAGGKDTRDLRAAVLTRRDVARLREGKLPLEKLRIRDNADVDENRIDRQRLLRDRQT